MTEEALHVDREYIIKAGAHSTYGSVISINNKVDVNTMEKGEANQLVLNEIGSCNFETAEALHFDSYSENRAMGAFIMIDRLTNATVGAGMISGSVEALAKTAPEYSAFEVEFNALVRKHYPHWETKDILKG
jgi:sulfate adenylyltransferase subunit 1